MRILYVISELGYGGAEKQAVAIAKQMVERGHEVAIFTLNRDVPRTGELAGSRVTLIVDQKKAKFDLAVLARLRRTLVRWRPELVHGYLFDGNFYARVAGLGTGIPVLNSERSDNYRLSPLQSVAHRLTRGLARGVVANTFAGSRFAQRLFELPQERVHVVWNGLRLEDMERHAVTAADYRREFFGGERVRVACLVGAIKSSKDYHLALDAARLITADPRWRVLFVGDELAWSGCYRPGRDSISSEYKNEVFEHYRRLGRPDRIKFAGLRADALAIIHQSDVLFVTSVAEGFPNVVLEAMGLGVPVVSTEYSDIRLILPFCAQVVARRSPDDIARAVFWAHVERHAISQAQKKWVRDHATIEHAAMELERVYLKYVLPQPCAQPA